MNFRCYVGHTAEQFNGWRVGQLGSDTGGQVPV